MTDIKKAPQSADNIAVHLPSVVDGLMSPYPTVVRVITMHHKAFM